MRSSLLLAAVAVVAAGVEAIAISSNTTSVLLPSTTRRRGCGRLSSSGASPPVSIDAPDATSAASLSTLSLTTDTVSPGKTLATAASTSIDNNKSNTTSTESSTEASETVSATISGTGSNTEASPLVSSSLSTTDPTTIEPTGIVLPTLITTDSTSESSTTTVPTISSTESSTDTAILDSSTVSVIDFSTGTSTEITSSMTGASTTVVSESAATDSASLATTATSTTTTPTCAPINTVNGDFEAGPSDWTFTGNGAIILNGDDYDYTPYGNYYAKLADIVDTTSVMSQAVANVAPSATLSIDYRLTGLWDDTASCTLTATYADITLGSMTFNINSAAATGWQTATWSAIVDMPASGTLAISWGQCSSMNSNIVLDNVFLISSCPEDGPVPSL